MRVSRQIPSFFNGVSQQVPAMRLPSQVEDAVNVYCSLVEGTIKRPPLKHIAKLSSVTTTNRLVHIINRDSTERYALVLGDQTINIYDLAGTEKTITKASGWDTYLDCSDPRTDFAVISVADYTFIVNKTKKVTVDTTETQETEPYQALVWVKRGVSETKYAVVINGNEYAYTTPSQTQGLAKTDDIAAQLVTAIGANATCDRRGSVIKITNTTDFTFRVYDSWGEQAMNGIKHQVQKYTDLPPRCWDGFRVKVAADPDKGGDDYYVEFECDNDYGSGYWKESRGWGQYNKLKASVMPWALVRQTDGTFKLDPITWGERLVGDDDTAPMPSFVDSYISDVFFYRNRLGFVSGENVVLSRAGDFFKFFPESVTDILDSDPIDTAVSHTKVSIIRHAVPYNEQLLLFSEGTQFVMSSDQMLTPMDVRIDQTTEFETDKNVKPVGIGASVFFVVPKGNYSGIREYFAQEDTATNDAADITAHVPNYLPKNVIKLIGSSNMDLVFAASSDSPRNLYLYKYYWSGNEKVQSSWIKWLFDSDTVILGGDMIDTVLYLVIKRTDGTHLMSIDLESGKEDSTLGFQVLLDNRVELTGVYDGDEDVTTWTLPFTDSSTDYKVVLGTAFTGQAGADLTNLGRPTSNTIVRTGDWSAGTCYIGKPYEAYIIPSEQFVKQDAEEQKSITSGRLQLRDMTLHFSNSYRFDVEVTPLNRTAMTYTMVGKLGTAGRTIGRVTLTQGVFRFPVMSKSDQVTIKISNSTYFPSAWHSAEWAGEFVLLSKRM